MARAKLTVRTFATQITPNPGAWPSRGGWAPNQAARATVSLSVNLKKLPCLRRSGTSARLSCLTTPVETGAAPCRQNTLAAFRFRLTAKTAHPLPHSSSPRANASLVRARFLFYATSISFAAGQARRLIHFVASPLLAAPASLGCGSVFQNTLAAFRFRLAAKTAHPLPHSSSPRANASPVRARFLRWIFSADIALCCPVIFTCYYR